MLVLIILFGIPTDPTGQTRLTSWGKTSRSKHLLFLLCCWVTEYVVPNVTAYTSAKVINELPNHRWSSWYINLNLPWLYFLTFFFLTFQCQLHCCAIQYYFFVQSVRHTLTQINLDDRYNSLNRNITRKNDQIIKQLKNISNPFLTQTHTLPM